MDFTATYDHAAAECVSFSPGSTFIAYIDGERQSAVQVRVSGTLQVVRSWELGTPLQALSWSPDGLFLLACAYTVPGRDERNGRSYILPLDPDASVTDGSDDGQGWVARIDAGIGGLQQAAWVPVWRVPSIVQFASYETGGVLYSLADQAFTALPGVLLPKGTCPMLTQYTRTRCARTRWDSCSAMQRATTLHCTRPNRPTHLRCRSPCRGNWSVYVVQHSPSRSSCM